MAASGQVVVVGADHGGYALKEAIKRHLTSRGVDVLDVGTSSTDPVDYPVFARAAAEAVASGLAERGIVVDGAGIGSAMAANKVPGIRAGMAFDLATAKNAREHNDANVLTLGAGYLAEELALQIVDAFLSTECTAERHRRRVAMIDAIDAIRSNAPDGPHGPAPSRSSPPMTSPSFDSLVDRITQILAANPSLLVPPTCAGCAGCAAAGATECPAGGHCVTRCPDTVRSMIACVGPGCRVSAAPGVGEVPKDLAKFIDHTLLRADATYADIDKLCDEADQFGFASVCVNPVFVKRCAARLAGSSSVVCTVVGFPLGAIPREMKAMEARRAVREGASEIDMVIAIGALKSGDLRTVEEDIRAVAEAAHDGGAILKVILETALLTDEEKVAGCVAARKARAEFVKTSTGFSTGGATARDVELMAQAVDRKLGVKASGGIRSAEDAQKLIAAGATRIGASVGVKIVKEARGLAASPREAKGAY
ncbi:MAG TPA: deoxyribose-phosphate aldolase [Thermoanaerobaculia bacterium]|nr:deoxyribose-phosphate aldolase [Thermoanaerobaculia bacterium]